MLVLPIRRVFGVYLKGTKKIPFVEIVRSSVKIIRVYTEFFGPSCREVRRGGLVSTPVRAVRGDTRAGRSQDREDFYQTVDPSG